VDSAAAGVIRTTSMLNARERAVMGEPMPDPDAQAMALVDAVVALAAAGIETALIGGVAVGVRSDTPRATLDVDLAAPSRTSRHRVVAVLEAAGFVHRGSFPHSENFRHTNGQPVQVAFDMSFDAAIGRAESMVVLDVPVAVVTTDDLVAMKLRAAADPTRRRSKALRDLADVALLRGDRGDDDEGW